MFCTDLQPPFRFNDGEGAGEVSPVGSSLSELLRLCSTLANLGLGEISALASLRLGEIPSLATFELGEIPSLATLDLGDIPALATLGLGEIPSLATLGLEEIPSLVTLGLEHIPKSDSKPCFFWQLSKTGFVICNGEKLKY